MNDEIYCLKKGWRRSMRTGAWFRRRNGWLAVVSGNDDGFLLVMNKSGRTFEDVLADANEIMTGEDCPESSVQKITRWGA